MSSSQNLLKLNRLIKVNTVIENHISRLEMITAGEDERGRNINYQCHYPSITGLDYFKHLYSTDGIASRIISIYPEETWKNHPSVRETEDAVTSEFEKRFDLFQKEHSLFSQLQVADELSGIGQYGALFLGINDQRKLSAPVQGINDKGLRTSNFKPNKVLFLRPFDQVACKVNKTVTDTSDKRFGQPLTYNVRFDLPEYADYSNTGYPPASEETVVHWTRLIHFPSDGNTGSPTNGTPRLQKTWPRVEDLKKITSGSGEMFWLGALPGWGFEALPEFVATGELDDASIKEQVDRFNDNLQRFIAVVGFKINSLSPQVVDPNPHIDAQIAVLSTMINVPVRIFRGSESGVLASELEVTTWNSRLRKRKMNHTTPYYIENTINRLVLIGELPQPKSIITSWTDPNSQTDTERADVSMKKAQALLQYVTSGAEKIMPVQRFYDLIMGLTDDQVESIMKDLQKNPKLLTKEIWKKGPTQTKGIGKNPAKKTGQKRNATSGRK